MPRNGQTKDAVSEVTGPRSLTRLLGLFDVLAKSKDGLTLAELNQALQSSGYFEGVRVDAAPTAATDNVIPVAVKLDTRKPRTMGLGLGFSTDVGPRAKANWTRHWVNPQGRPVPITAEGGQPIRELWG